MTHAYIALLIYCLWMISMLFMMLVVRVKAVRKGLRSKDITPFNENISPFANRLSRAHANCYENLPIFAAIVLVVAMNNALDILQGTALVFIVARILQSMAHFYSGRMRVVMIRGAFFGVQVFLQIYWIIMLLIKIM